MAGFGFGTLTHALDYVRYGWLSYRFGPPVSNALWNALVLLDAGVVALLTLPPAGPAATDRAHWTPARQRIFLHVLLDTGSVVRAARAAGMTRSSAYRFRERLAGTPFDRTWRKALEEHAARLADPFAASPVAPPSRERSAPVAKPSRR